MSMLTVVVPAYNEREAIAQVVGRILATRGALRAKAGIAELEVLVVDDGSTDGTRAMVSRLMAHAQDARLTVRLIRHARNRGYGAALQTGFACARGNLLAFLDADSTYPPEHLPELCRAVCAPGVDLVLGDRMRSDSSRMPRLRWLGNTLFAFLASLLAGQRIADCCSGMRVFPQTTWRRLRPLPNGLDFSPAMTIRALHQHLNLVEVVIPYHERVGRSKLRVARDGMRFLLTILCETYTFRPCRLWTLVGPAIGSGLALVAALMALRAGHEPGWARMGIGVFLGVAAFGAGLRLAGEGVDSHAPPAASPLALVAIAPQSHEEEQAS